MPSSLEPLKLPLGWVWARIEDVCLELVGGGTPSREVPEYFGGHIVWLTPTEVPKDKVVVLNSSKEKITEIGLKNSSARIIPKGSVLLTSRASIGFVAIAGCDLTTNQGFASFLCSTAIYNFYLAYWLWTNRDMLAANATGTTFKEIAKSKLREFYLPLPPLAEQKRIVAKIEELFTRLDAGVEALKKVKAQIRHYRQAVLKYAFEGKLTEKWRRNNPSSVQSRENSEKLGKDEILLSAQNDKGAYNENMPELPEGWRWVKLGEIAEINPKFSGYDISDHTEVTFLSMKCVEELTGHLDLSNIKRLSEVKKGYTPFIEGDVLFAKITPCMENGKVAIAHNLKNSIGFGSTEFHVIRPTELLLNKFLFFYFIREDFRKNAQSYMTGSAGQLRVPASYMQQTLIPLPPLPEQHQIVEEIERRFSVIEQVEKIVDQSLKQAERLRQSILKRAFEGKLVPQDPNDEPVEKLLERIKQQREQSDKMRTSKRKRRK